MDRKIYHVTHSVNGWKAEREKSDVIVCEGERKEEVVNCIRHKAKQEGNSQIVIHGRNGRIMEERTYGNDPEKTYGSSN